MNTGMGLDRHSLPGYLRQLLQQASELGDDELLVRHFRVAGLRLKLRFADPAIADIYSERLVNQTTGNAQPHDLRVDILDAERLGWPSPRLWDDFGCAEGWLEEGLRAAGLRAAYPYQPRFWTCYDQRASTALQFTGAIGDLPIWDFGAPIRNVIHWAMADRGLRLLHSATLGSASGGVLISGPGGSGKSGTTTAGVLHGMKTVGDDYVIVENTDTPAAWPAYRLFKQDPTGIARMGPAGTRLAGRPVNWQGKVEFDPEELAPGCHAERMRLRAIMVPSVARLPATRIEPIPRGKAVEAIARSTIFQLSGDLVPVAMFATVLASRLPAFQVQLSGDPSEVATTLAEWVAGLA